MAKTHEDRLAEIASHIDDAANGPFGRTKGRWLLRQLRIAQAENARLRDILAACTTTTPDPEPGG